VRVTRADDDGDAGLEEVVHLLRDHEGNNENAFKKELGKRQHILRNFRSPSYARVGPVEGWRLVPPIIVTHPYWPNMEEVPIRHVLFPSLVGLSVLVLAIAFLRRQPAAKPSWLLARMALPSFLSPMTTGSVDPTAYRPE
jgi:hypothetical protein